MKSKKYRGMKQKVCVSFLVGSVILSTTPLHTFAADNTIRYAGSQQVSGSGQVLKLQEDDTPGIPRVIPTTVRELFDAEYYLLLYPELSDLGDDPDALYEHFINYGLKEGRKCSPYLDLAKYISENEDLREAYGEDWDAYVVHYFTYGIKEGRSPYVTDFDRYLQSVLKNTENPDRTTYGQALLDFYLAQSQIQPQLQTQIQPQLQSQIPQSRANEPCGGEAKDCQSPAQSEIQVNENTVIIPWDYVENGYVTLDMIKAHCGENLILVQNKQGDVTFLAGDISSKSVTDTTSALETIKSMLGVLKLDDETDLCLSLTSVRTDSEGNSIYEFMPLDEASGRYATTITDVQIADDFGGSYEAVVRLKAGSEGTVIAFSSTSEDSYTRYQILNENKKVIDSRTNAISKELSAEVKEKYEILGDYKRNYMDDMLYQGEYFVKNKADGTIGILCYEYETGNQYFYKIDPEVYQASGGEDSYPLDYLLNQAAYEEMTLKDYFGNETTVPVAHMTTADGEDIYYLASKADRTIMFVFSGLANTSGTIESVDSYSDENLVKLSMGADGVLTPVNTSLNMGDLVCMYSYILDARRYFQSVDPVKTDSSPYIINYFYEDKTVNASGGEGHGLTSMDYENCYLLKTYDTAVHEATHSMTVLQFFSAYTNYSGAISEGYADIMGLCLQQKKYDELVSDYMSKNEATLKEAQSYVDSHFTDFSDTWYASYYKDENGNIQYLYDAEDPCNNHQDYSYATKVGDENFGYFPYSGYETYDNYNCHANSSVLSHIAYEMYENGIISDVEELASIWYDSVNYITGESEFYDIRYYVEESMKEHGCNKEAIEETDKLFEECNITMESRNQDLLATPENLKAENNLSTESEGEILDLQQNTLETEQAARISADEIATDAETTTDAETVTAEETTTADERATEETNIEAETQAGAENEVEAEVDMESAIETEAEYDTESATETV